MTHSADAIASRGIPADFVVERAILSPARVALGLAQGWIDANDVVAIATSAVAEPTTWADDFTELACLPASAPENQWTVPALLSAWPPDADDVPVWKYLAVAHVFESRAQDPDWMNAGAQVVDAFGNFDDMRSLLPWTPPPVGITGGDRYMEECYRNYLQTLRSDMPGVLRPPGGRGTVLPPPEPPPNSPLSLSDESPDPSSKEVPREESRSCGHAAC